MSKEKQKAPGQADGNSNHKSWQAFTAHFKQQLLESLYFASSELTAVLNFLVLVLMALGVSEFLFWSGEMFFPHAMADMGWMVKGVKYALFALAALQLVKRAVLHLLDKSH